MASTYGKIRKSAIRAGYRSGLEQDNAKLLKAHQVEFQYEKLKLKFIPKPRTYTPDFQMSNGIIIETKGRFMPSDRSKHLMIQQQHPNLDIRFVFSSSRTKLSKISKATYGDWCDKYGFKYADKLIPIEWMEER